MVWLAVWCALTTFGATQTIEVQPGENLIAVEIQVGENRLVELFPEAPVGTIIYRFDNSSGWMVAQKYPSGWSEPNQRIRAFEGAVMIVPTNGSVNFTLTGEEVALPPVDYVTLNSSTNRANIYRNHNLISSRLAQHLSRVRGEAANVYVYSKSLKRFAVLVFDNLSNEWFPTTPPVEGAVWFQTSEALAHRRGTFANTNTPLYYNNFAPAYGIDRPFRDSNCVARTSGTISLSVPGSHGFLHYGYAHFSTNFPGYFEPSGLGVRYVRPEYSIQVYDQAESSILTGSFSVGPVSVNPPMWPVPAAFPPIPVSGPQNITFRPGTNGQIYVTLTSDFRGSRLYQWQKMDWDGEWEDLAGATNRVLGFENMEAEDAGQYRARITLNCEDVFSDTATVSYLAPVLTFRAPRSGSRVLEARMPVATGAKIQSSMDLENWSDFAEVEKMKTVWATNVITADSARFYRAVEVP